MIWIYHDGGRAEAGFKGSAGDCAARSIAISTGRPYLEIYNLLAELGKSERPRNGRRSHPRTGIFTRTVTALLEPWGWAWVPTMWIGSGCRVHLVETELPRGSLVVRLSKHFTSVVDGVIFDDHDPSRDGSRCVYGYWRKT